MNKESFVFYKSFFESIEEIENSETKSKAYKAIAGYALFGEEPTKESEEIVRVIFRQAKPLLDKSKARYDNCVTNGKKGGRPKKNKNQEITKTKPRENQTITKEKPKTNQEETKGITKTKPNPNLNDNVNDNDNYINKEREIERKKQENNFFSSLSQNYKNIEINTKTINPDYNLDKIIIAIKQSEFLQNAPLSFILSNYEKVITNCYKSFKKDNNKAYTTRDYNKDALNNCFDNPEDINL